MLSNPRPDPKIGVAYKKMADVPGLPFQGSSVQTSGPYNSGFCSYYVVSWILSSLRIFIFIGMSTVKTDGDGSIMRMNTLNNNGANVGLRPGKMK